MSGTQQQPQTVAPPPPDQYLLSQTAPQQEIKIDPQFGSIRMVTPVGRFSYANLVTPKAVQAGQPPIFSVTLLFNPAACGDLWKAMCMLADHRWPSNQVPNPQPDPNGGPGQMVTVAGHQLLTMPKEYGGLHNPLRKGDLEFYKAPAKHGAYFGTFALNMGVKALGKQGQSQQPAIVDERGVICPPQKIYSGSYGRAYITLFAFPQPGQQIPNRGIGISLQSVQFARDGEKLAGFDVAAAATAAFAAAGALPVTTAPAGAPGTPGAPAPGFGENYGSPWAGGPPPGQPPAGGPPAAGGWPPSPGQHPAQPVQQQPVQYAPQPGQVPGQAPTYWQPPAGGPPPFQPS